MANEITRLSNPFQSLRIMHWNCRGFRSKEAILQAYVRLQELDVLLLQETNITESPRFPGYEVYVLPPAQRSWGCMTIVKRNLNSQKIDSPISCGDQIELLGVQLFIGNKTLSLYNIYKPHTGTLDLGELFTEAEEEDTIIAGDFNAHHPILLESPRPANATGRHIAEILPQYTGVTLLNNTKEPTHTHGGRLDLTFASTALVDYLTWDINSGITSDHYPVTITLQTPVFHQVAAQQPRWRLDKANWTLFKAKIEEWEESYEPTDDVNQLERDLTKAMQDAANASIPKYYPGKSARKDWWYYNYRIKEYNHQACMAQRKFRQTRSDLDLANLRAATARQQEVAAEVRTEKWLEWCATFNAHTSLRELWQKLRTATGHRPRCRLHHNPVQEAQRLAVQFAGRTYSSSLPANITVKLQEKQSERQQRVDQACAQADDTDRDFTLQELKAAMKKSKDTAPGHDHLTYSMVAHLGMAGEVALLRIINTSWQQGQLPDMWKKADIIPISKRSDPTSHRPISLLSVLCKTYERQVLTRLRYKLGTPHENLHGFTKGRSTQHSIGTLLSLVHGNNAVVVFLDLEKAFELANPLAILDGLARKNIRGRLLRMVADYLHGRQARVKLQGYYSDYHCLENGTPQGGILSPTLFNVLMTMLLDIKLPEGCTLISYADDLALIVAGGRGPRIHTTRKALNILQDACDDLGLKISTTKTKAMRFGKRNTKLNLKIYGQDIEWVAKFQYLGVWIDQNLTFVQEVTYLRDRVNSRLRPLRALAFRNNGCNYRVLRAFYTHAIRSVIDYAALTIIGLSKNQQTRLEVAQNQCARVLLGAPRWTLTDNARVECQLTTLYQRAQRLCANFVAKVLQSPEDSRFRQKLVSSLQQGQEMLPLNKWSGRALKTLWTFDLATTLLQKGPDGPSPRYTPPPPWAPPPATYSIMPGPHRSLSEAALRQKALQHIATLPTNDTSIYFTDGSVDDKSKRAGAAFIADSLPPIKISITGCCSSLQAEAVAIQHALAHALTTHQKHVIINTDSLSLIYALQQTPHKDNISLITDILAHMIQLQEQGRQIIINWVPGHVNIAGNEIVDKAARAACTQPNPDFSINLHPSRAKLKEDAKQKERKHLLTTHKTASQHSVSAKWYRTVTQYNPPALNTSTTRAEEQHLFRIRLGWMCRWERCEHPAEPCAHCNTPATSLDHWLLTCPATAFLRRGPNTTAEGIALRLIQGWTTYIKEQVALHPPPC